MKTTFNEEYVRKIIRECIHDEIQRLQRLDEMSRVGFMEQYDVIVYTDDMGYVPHVHVIDRATHGQDFDTCICLNSTDYFLHGKHNDIFNTKDRKRFAEFMLEPSRNIHYRNNYEAAVNLWNDNNSKTYVQIIEDESGNIIVPDYTLLPTI
jgi:hypothetical protein